MEIIGAGFPRTGTMSVKLALEALGFGPCYHMREVLSHRDHVRVWSDAAHGNPVDWGAVFRGYRAAVDMPSAAFYRELLAAFPRARALLTVRDPEKWYASVSKTVYALSKVRSPDTHAFARMVDDVFWSGILHGRFEDKGYTIEVYERHVEEVKSVVGPDRLLVFNVKEGWEPLCHFLGVPVPDAPFPHANDANIFTDYLRLKWLADDAGAAENGGKDYRQRLHQRMLEFERQLLEEIRGGGADAE